MMRKVDPAQGYSNAVRTYCKARESQSGKNVLSVVSTVIGISAVQISAVQRRISGMYTGSLNRETERVWKAPQRENVWNLRNALNMATERSNLLFAYRSLEWKL